MTDDVVTLSPPLFEGDTSDEDLLAHIGAELPPLSITDPARVARIAREAEASFTALAHVRQGVSVFGSARLPADATPSVQARELGRRLGDVGFTVITGGGPGVMEAANRGACDVDAPSVGLLIELPFEERPNDFLTLAVRFRYFFVRKVAFVRYASGFVVLPGGFGTLDELFEALTLMQTGKVHDFPVVLVGRDHWQPLIDWLRTGVQGMSMISDGDLDLVRVTDDLDEVVELLTVCHLRQVGALDPGTPAPEDP